jgi:hypothetical protein
MPWHWEKIQKYLILFSQENEFQIQIHILFTEGLFAFSSLCSPFHCRDAMNETPEKH